MRELWRGSRWALARTFRAEPRLCSMLLIAAFVSAMLPSATALTIGGFAGALKSATGAVQSELVPAFYWLGATIVLVFLGTATGALRSFCQDLLSDKMYLDLSQAMLEHADRLDVAQFEDPGFQDVLSRATRNPGHDFVLFLAGIVDTAAMAVNVLCLLGVLLWIEPAITPLLVVSALPLLLHRWRMAKKRYAVDRAKTTNRRWSRYYFSQVTGQRLVLSTKLLNLAPLMVDRFRSLYLDIIATMRRLYRVRALGQVGATFVYLAILLVVVTWVGLRSLAQASNMGVIVTYGLAAFRLCHGFDALSRRISGALESSLFIGNLNEFLNVEPAVVDTKALVTEVFRGEIVLENVSFTYPGAATPALQGVSLRIMPGETIAMVGRNGSGKTTLVKLIARFYDVTEGRILIDGTDIRDLSLRNLRDQLAYVFQYRTTYEATAGENIAYGDWPRLLDDPDAVQRVAEEAGAGDLISSLPDGLDTHLGRLFGMFTLSRGQWQRLAIARALARRNAILVLDEPTADLDVTAERDLFASVRELAADRTAILVSHRFSTVHIADRIFLLDAARLVEQGTHDELLARQGLYTKWYQTYWENQGYTPNMTP